MPHYGIHRHHIQRFHFTHAAPHCQLDWYHQHWVVVVVRPGKIEDNEPAGDPLTSFGFTYSGLLLSLLESLLILLGVLVAS